MPVEALTDRGTVSYAPSGTMFAWLRERRDGRAAPAATLLALGDPTFRQAGANDGGRVVPSSSQTANDRSDELAKREDRRGREAG